MSKKIDQKPIPDSLADLIDDFNLNYQGSYKILRYIIKILDENGDALIKVKSHIVNTTNTSLKDTRTILTSNHSMVSSKMNFHAVSGKDDLDSELTLDRPTEKHFSIYFPKVLKFMDDISISYSYLWECMFPEKEESFVVSLARPCAKLDFLLSSPYNLESFRLVRYSRITGEKEDLPLRKNYTYWDKQKTKIKVSLIPDLFSKYTYIWQKPQTTNM